MNRIIVLLLAFAAPTIFHYGAQYLWSAYPQARLLVYGLIFLLMIAGGYVVFKSLTRQSYQKHGGLNDAALWLSAVMWGCFFAFPSIYSPFDWSWSWSREVDVPVFVQGLSAVLVAAGLLGIVSSFYWLGFFRSMGERSTQLITTGPYRLSRNPQLAASALIILGYILLRPSWWAVGWVLLFFFFSLTMIRSEEEHLQHKFGAAFTEYCTKTRRFI